MFCFNGYYDDFYTNMKLTIDWLSTFLGRKHNYICIADGIES